MRRGDTFRKGTKRTSHQQGKIPGVPPPCSPGTCLPPLRPCPSPPLLPCCCNFSGSLNSFDVSITTLEVRKLNPMQFKVEAFKKFVVHRDPTVCSLDLRSVFHRQVFFVKKQILNIFFFFRRHDGDVRWSVSPRTEHGRHGRTAEAGAVSDPAGRDEARLYLP